MAFRAAHRPERFTDVSSLTFIGASRQFQDQGVHSGLPARSDDPRTLLSDLRFDDSSVSHRANMTPPRLEEKDQACQHRQI
jgi:hypothetical protein